MKHVYLWLILCLGFLNSFSQQTDTSKFIVPVVVHILHTNGPENISDEQVYEAIRILNEDYNKLNADTSEVEMAFKSIIGNARIEFRLATRDTAGNCTNGIRHIYTYNTNIVGDYSKQLYHWPRNQYLNIWVVNATFSGASGYTYLPSTVASQANAWMDGVMLLYDSFGSIGTSSPNAKRTLTHEVGHWLNLKHLGASSNQPGADNCGDDEVEDTPTSAGWSICDTNFYQCTPPHLINTQNFMEFNFCTKMFTNGQCARMRNCLSSSIAQRNELVSVENLQFTGTADPYNPPLCVPVAYFHASQLVACEGDSVTFYDNSFNAHVNDFFWTIPGAIPETSNSPNPTFYFPTSGLKTVSLAVSNNAGSNILTKSNFIDIKGNFNDHQPPYFEDFSNPDVATSQWAAGDMYSNTYNWHYTQLGGYSGGGAYYFNNFGASNGEYDYLVSPAFDFSYASSVKLRFKYSVATYASALDEKLRIYATKNCGKTWIKVKEFTGANLISAGQWNTAYWATNDELWTEALVSLGSSYNVSGLRFKFEFYSTGKGNNAWIDDINIDATLGIVSQEPSSLSIFPNPATNQVKVKSQSNQATLTDLTGKTLLTTKLKNGEAQVDVSSLDNGIYFLKTDKGNMQKIIVQH